MTTTTVYYPHAIVSGNPALTLTQLDDVQPAHNYQDLTEFAAGQVGPQFTGTHLASPDNRFSSTQLKAILDVCIAGKYNVIRDLSGGNVDVEFKAGENRGTRIADASLAHIRGRMANNAAICWESFAARMGGTVSLRCRIVAVQVGGNDPLIFTNSLALTASSDVTQLYTLGPVKINGTFLSAVQEVDWANNLQYEEIADSGEPFPTYFGVMRLAPVLTVRTRDLSVVSTFGTRGTALSALSQFLRKKLVSDINEADATAVHIALTATTGTVKARQISGNMAEVQVHLRQSAQNVAPFSISTTSAIA
jgi:hypothetical protein